VPSAFLKERVFLEGIPRERTDLLYWPVEPAVGRTDTPHRDGAVSRLLFVGAVIPEKGPDVLIDAMKQAISSCPDLSLTLVGEGPAGYMAVLRQAAMGLPVRFTGRLERSAVIDAYRSHDVLVFPSTWEEPYAVVPLEAMSMGLAVIATRTGGTPEAVSDGDTGLLVPAGDPRALAEAIVRLAADPGFSRALAARGQAWARGSQGFDPFMDRLTALYRKLTPAARKAA
jgi:glycosyltransferase involved in cell wall biosynthesis